jgi:hypothetical protein
VSDHDPVELIVVSTELEAVELVGYLGENGIEATYERGGSAGWYDDAESGPQRVFVLGGDLERAQQLLEEAK